MGKHNLCMILVSLTLDVVGTAGLGSLEYLCCCSWYLDRFPFFPTAPPLCMKWYFAYTCCGSYCRGSLSLRIFPRTWVDAYQSCLGRACPTVAKCISFLNCSLSTVYSKALNVAYLWMCWCLNHTNQEMDHSWHCLYFLSWCHTYWDDWLRLNSTRKGRHFIRPEICRTYNYGEQVCPGKLYTFFFLGWLLLSCFFIYGWFLIYPISPTFCNFYNDVIGGGIYCKSLCQLHSSNGFSCNFFHLAPLKTQEVYTSVEVAIWLF